MNDWIKKHQLDRIWANNSKREAFFNEDGNWVELEVSKTLKTEILTFTPYIRVQVYKYASWCGKHKWITLAYFKTKNNFKGYKKELLNKELVLENVNDVVYNQRDILNWMKERAYELKQTRKPIK